MESPHTENKVISYDFSSSCVSAFKRYSSKSLATCVYKRKKRKQYMEGVVEWCSVFLGGGIIPALWLWDVACRHGSYPIAWHSLRKYVQRPLMYFTCYCLCQSNLFFISTWLLCIFYFFFFLRRNFNIYSIKAKRAVNRMQFVVQIVIGGRPDLWSCHSEYIDIKEMQMAYLS